MKTILNYYYNLYPDNIIKVKTGYYFFYEEYKYYIVPVNRPIEDLKLLTEVNKKLQKLSLAGYIILNDKDNKEYIEFESKNYVVLKVIIDEEKELSIKEILAFNNALKTRQSSVLTKENWKQLWSDKVDYFEYQMSVSKNNDYLERSFNYYIGLAENAISYVSDTFLEEQIKDEELVLSHKRIPAKPTNYKIYNPLSFIFDYEVRDVAEYIKAKFFNKNLNWDEIEELLYTRKYSTFSLRLLYARLLYPSYYFDIYESYKNHVSKEKEMKEIISLTEEYEEFLFDMYMLIKKITPIPEIRWIMRKKV